MIIGNNKEVKKIYKDNEAIIGIKKGTLPIFSRGSIMESLLTLPAKITAATKKIKDLKIYGNTSQDGTPTPDTPVEIQNVTGLQNINVCGKNLLPQDKYITTRTTNGITFTNNGDGTFNLVGTASANTTIQIIPIGNISLEANQPYYLFSSQPYNVTTFNLSIAMTNNGTKFILANGTYTPTATPTNVRLQFYIANGQSVNATNVKMMLVKGNTAPSQYEPYQSQTYPINLGSMELCKIGNYQDRIYKDNGKWYIEKQTGKAILDGSESNWETSGAPVNVGVKAYRLPNIVTKIGGTNETDGYSDHFIVINNLDDWFTTEHKNSGYCIFTSNHLYIRISETLASTVADLKTWLGTVKPEIYYVLATPVEEEITDNELISQLNAIELVNGDNYINSSSTYLQISQIFIKYRGE